jgi:hypothetical protein
MVPMAITGIVGLSVNIRPIKINKMKNIKKR